MQVRADPEAANVRRRGIARHHHGRDEPKRWFAEKGKNRAFLCAMRQAFRVVDEARQCGGGGERQDADADHRGPPAEGRNAVGQGHRARDVAERAETECSTGEGAEHCGGKFACIDVVGRDEDRRTARPDQDHRQRDGTRPLRGGKHERAAAAEQGQWHRRRTAWADVVKRPTDGKLAKRECDEPEARGAGQILWRRAGIGGEGGGHDGEEGAGELAENIAEDEEKEAFAHGIVPL